MTSTETKMTSKKGQNPMLLYNVIQEIGRKSSLSDLNNLRQLSAQHYNLLNAIYFDLYDQSFTIYQLSNYWETNTNSLKILKDLFHTYRTLRIFSFYFLLKQFPAEVNELLITMTTCITKIDIHLVLENYLEKLFQAKDQIHAFIQSFRKLQRIDIISLPTSFVTEETLELLLKIINVSRSTLIGIPLQMLTSPNGFLEMYGNVGNIRIIQFSGFDIDTPSQLDQFTQLFLKYNKIIEDRKFSFYFNSNNYTNENEAGVKNNLALLAPYAESLSIDQRRMIEPWDLLSGINWPVLEHLSVTKYQHPLKFLKNDCPKLQRLEFNSCDINCFLSPDPEDETNLSDVVYLERLFSNLTSISSIGFWNMDAQCKYVSTTLSKLFPKASVNFNV